MQNEKVPSQSPLMVVLQRKKSLIDGYTILECVGEHSRTGEKLYVDRRALDKKQAPVYWTPKLIKRVLLDDYDIAYQWPVEL